MQKEDLLKLIEGKNIELKKAKNNIPDSFWETYSAFANTNGGLIVLGVDEKNSEVLGVDNPYKLRDDLLNNLNNPKKVSTNILNDENINIIKISEEITIMIIDIPEASYRIKPIYLKNNPRLAYVRLGEGDRLITAEKYKELIFNSKDETDIELLKKYDISDLNIDDIDVYKKELYKKTGNEKYLNIDNIDLLIEIGAMRKDRQGDGKYYLTTGGLLFFGKLNSITDRFPGFQLDYFEKESSLITNWIDRISSGDLSYPELNLYSFYRNVMDKFKIIIKDKFIIDEESKSRISIRTDLLTSVRECLVNVLMHSYYDSDSPIKITVYHDYFEFKNPGKMRITIDEFINGGNSNIRNHTISSIMRRIGISEKAGSGGPRIFDISSKYKLKLPEIIREEDETIIRVWKIDLERKFEKFSNDQKKILFFLIENHYITRSSAEKKLNIDKYTFRNVISELLDEKIIEIEGKGRATKYTLNKNSEEKSYSMKKMLRFLEDQIKKIK
ncbi:RNA-binding domain-containing protein [Streptobacillus felis]|uniref:ATP-binding protein n=1 Tax=Streptobacillus felis TaxID=1384509 RepID=UPI00082F60D8|nr:RNA-binding domain-containing protein [Streptobacillus felis]